jgi:LysR family glycine cleavage system transcriptional activator
MLQADMSRRLPSLNALRAFEAAARHESFTLAATELFVTHAAISRHIRDLEEWLGVDLFTRTGRGVLLTQAGRQYAEQLTSIFDQLANATREAMASAKIRKLAVTVDPSWASRWLVPRLGHFSDAHPDIELFVDPNPAVVDIASSEFDIGLRVGQGNWPDLDITRIAEFDTFPVCSPKLLEGEEDISPTRLAEYGLIHSYSRQWWTDWLEAAGVSGVDTSRGPVFQNYMAIEAAEAGQGFALADMVLATDSLAEGWLLRPFDQIVREPGGYFIVRAKGTKETPAARAFREWVLAEMVETQRKFASLRPSQGQKKQAASPAPLFNKAS